MRTCARAENSTTPLIKGVKLRVPACSHESGTTEICFSKFITTYLIAVIHHLYDWE